MLNYEQIKSKNLIQNSIDGNFKNASYDLRVDKIITLKGKEVKSFDIEPNSMVVVISKEDVKLPEDIIGHAYVKTRLSQQGIMANNIGLIDSEYKGPLSSVLVNFGKSVFTINEGDVFLRITFTQFVKPEKSHPINYGPFSKEAYLDKRKIDSMSYLGNSFVNIDEVVKVTKKEIKKSYRRTWLVYGVWATAIGLILTAATLFFTIDHRKINEVTIKKVDNLQNEINLFNENQVILRSIQKELNNNVVSLKSDLDSISLKNKELKRAVEEYKRELKENAPNKGK